MNNAHADFTCGGKPGYVAVGAWTYRDGALTLTSTWLATAGEPVRGKLPEWTFKVEPKGNALRLTLPGSTNTYDWQRAAP